MLSKLMLLLGNGWPCVTSRRETRKFRTNIYFKDAVVAAVAAVLTAPIMMLLHWGLLIM